MFADVLHTRYVQKWTLERAHLRLGRRGINQHATTMIQPSETTGGNRPDNNLLRMIQASDFALIEPQLTLFVADPGRLLYSPGDHVATVYFPCGSSLASFRVVTEEGKEVESILVGREGAVGGIISQGNVPAFARTVVQFSGPFVSLKLEDLERAQQRSRSLAGLFARYADCLVAQILQSTACNATHSIEQRVAKWILSAMERTGDHRVPLTHAQLARLLGVGRNYASRTLQVLRTQGLLETRRGALFILDQQRLATHSCLCNEAVRTHFDRVLRGLYPSGDITGAAQSGSAQPASS